MKRWDGIYKIISPFTKRRGPDGKIHQGWCAIFEHECCSCDNDDDGRPRSRPRKPKPLPPDGDDYHSDPNANKYDDDCVAKKVKSPRKKAFEFA